jgi:hypothetical protein
VGGRRRLSRCLCVWVRVGGERERGSGKSGDKERGMGASTAPHGSTAHTAVNVTAASVRAVWVYVTRDVVVDGMGRERGDTPTPTSVWAGQQRHAHHPT